MLFIKVLTELFNRAPITKTPTKKGGKAVNNVPVNVCSQTRKSIGIDPKNTQATLKPSIPFLEPYFLTIHNAIW